MHDRVEKLNSNFVYPILEQLSSFRVLEYALGLSSTAPRAYLKSADPEDLIYHRCVCSEFN